MAEPTTGDEFLHSILDPALQHQNQQAQQMIAADQDRRDATAQREQEWADPDQALRAAFDRHEQNRVDRIRRNANSG